MQITALIGVMVGQSFFIIMAENFPLFETKLKCIEKLSTLIVVNETSMMQFSRCFIAP